MIEWTTEKRKVSELKDYAKNPRRFTEKGMADLRSSLERLGYIDPIAINIDGTIIGGHARKKMLKELGLKEVDVRVPSRELTEKEVEEAIIRLNRNQAGEWNFDDLANHFNADDLIEWGFAAEELGLTAVTEGLTDPDAVPLPPETPVSVLGDVWLLGGHRLMCGSSTEADAVAKLLGGVSPTLMVTDPPYGVSYDPTWRDNAGGQFGDGKTKMRGKVENDDRADWTEAYALFPGDVAYVWHGGLHSNTVAKNLQDCGFNLRAQIIWVKPHFIMSRGDYHWMHEPCWYAVRKTGKGHWAGDRKQTTIWQIAGMNPAGGSHKAEDDKTAHGTQKPVECMKRPIENNSSPGQAVYEPFSGSGTTIIAGEMTGRSIYAMELSPEYVDMAVIRWQNFTGKEAAHAETGETFNSRANVLAEGKTAA